MRAASDYVQFIGLNPSTADETKDDPTVRRCIDFARRWGFGALCITNAFAFRATDPHLMLAESHPNEISGATTLHLPNDYWLTTVASEAGLVVAAWGRHGNHMDRGNEIRRVVPNLYCLGVNSDGTPKHPLYLRNDLRPGAVR